MFKSSITAYKETSNISLEMKNFIPTVDLSPFFKESDQHGKKKAMEVIGEACSQYGFFQIVNHGIPPELLNRALLLSKTFFGYSGEEKLKSSPGSDAPLPAGYNRQPQHSPDKNEYLLVFPPGSSFNIYPQNPPDFKYVGTLFIIIFKFHLASTVRKVMFLVFPRETIRFF